MRKDLDQIIIDAYSQGYADHVKGRNKHIKNLDSDYWNVERESMHRHARDQADRIAPLRRFLRSNVGRPWNKIWHEICQNFDNRSTTGNHIRDHIMGLVSNHGLANEFYPAWRSHYPHFGRGFYIDSNGILKEEKSWSRRKLKSWRKENNINHFIRKIGNDFYFLTEHGWFRTDYIAENWYASGIRICCITDFILCKPSKCAVKDVPKYFIQTDIHKPFKITKSHQEVSKALYAVCDYRQCDKNEIKGKLR